MGFNPHKPDSNQQDYKISIKSAKGNTVAFINLTEQFIKSTTGKTKKTVTYEDISKINKGDLFAYLFEQTFMLEIVEPTEQIEAKDF